MAIFTIYLALKERLERHKRIAPYTAGIWIYLALTGWLIRAFLV
jgi:putative membrane protein